MIRTPTCPSSWKARMRCSGIARPMWMSGEVTSMPSFTRSGRPSFSFASRPPSGSTFTAFKVRSSSMSGATLAAVLALFRRKARPPKRRRIRKLRLTALLFVALLLGLSAFTFGLLTAIAEQIPALEPARQAQHQQANTYVYAGDGKTILAILRGSQARIVVDSEDISPWLKHSIVAVEDKRFYLHNGIDVRGILRAVKADITNHGTVQGGSTITQQFVKNAIDQNERTISRKLREAALAWRLERTKSKPWILWAYLNTVYFGNGAYGVEQACRIYFKHGADV